MTWFKSWFVAYLFGCMGGAAAVWSGGYVADTISTLRVGEKPDMQIRIRPPPGESVEPPVAPDPPETLPTTAQVIARRVIGNACAGSLYDGDFRTAVYLYWPPGLKDDWCDLKAQCTVESGLRPDAESPVGAVGLCQFMPGTWADWLQFSKQTTDRRDAAVNIRASAWYMAKLLQFWGAPRTPECRMELAQASYNAGAGRVHLAQKRLGGVCLSDFGSDLPEETRHYVPKIKEAIERLMRGA